MKRLLLLLTFVLLSGHIFAGDTKQKSINKNLDTYVEEVRKGWNIPGMGVAIMKDGELVYAKGFGVKELGKQELVTEHTLFQIGSVSKSFTAAVISSLVDEGRIKWSDTVKNILPDFRMYDKMVEENLLVSDLMTHKTGLKGQAGTYIPNLGYTREDIYKMLPLIKPSYNFRNTYAYNNITFIIASKVIETVSGKSWEENVHERIFGPVGMKTATLNGEGFHEAFEKGLSVTPHSTEFINGAIVSKPMMGEERALHWLTAIGPAGSVVASPVELAKWAQFHLDKGMVGENQVISTKEMNFLHRGLTIVNQNDERITLYGHCWFIEQTKKGKIYYHTGTTWGSTALCVFVPELKLSVAVLVNSEASSQARMAILRRLIDSYLDLPQYDYNAEYLAKYIADNSKEKEVKPNDTPVARTPKEKEIIGKYLKDELFGNAEIFKKKGVLMIKIGKEGWEHALTHSKGATYKFDSDGHTFPVTFNFNEKDKIVSFEIDFDNNEEFGPWVKK